MSITKQSKYKKLQAESVKKQIHYCHETGLLTWKIKKANAIKPGDHAGSKRKDGYSAVKINGCLYLSHRVAWAVHYGEWPSMSIDHINGDKSDNRIENLRECTVSQNCANVPMRKTNKSGMKGVTWHKPYGKWLSQIRVNKKTINLGYFENKVDAHAAYCEAAKKHFGEFAKT